MISFPVDRDVTLFVPFTQAPDPGQGTVNVYDSARNLLSSNSITLATDQTQAVLVIPAAQNGITGGRSFDTRVVVLNYDVGGISRAKRISYRIIPERRYTVEIQDVREFLGVRPEELEDSAVDLFGIYLELKILLGGTVLDDYLASGDLMEIAANEVIAMTAVLRVLPGLRNRVAQKESDGVVAFERIKISDYDQLQRAAEDRRSTALLVLAPPPIEADYNLVLIASPTDAITG